jgi:hypothetical protein
MIIVIASITVKAQRKNMHRYREQVKEMVAGVAIKVLQAV